MTRHLQNLKSSWDAMEMRLLSLLARDVLRAMFVSARVFRATTSSSKSTVSEGREFA